MIIISEKLGTIKEPRFQHLVKDKLKLEWYETDKRILQKNTEHGKHIALKFLGSAPAFREGDVIWSDDGSVIVISLMPCECIILKPKDPLELATVCYEIGNRHLPIFYSEGELRVAFEWPLFNLLNVLGYNVAKGISVLNHPLRSTITSVPHLSSGVLKTSAKNPLV